MDLKEAELRTTLDEQVAYYRARAPEYDEWMEQRGRYFHGPEATAAFYAELAEVEAALSQFNATGDVLEFACGTGWGTERLARTASSITCIDTAPEMVALNQARLRRAGLPEPTYILADLFSWKPARQYDVVYFGFWLSHVPRVYFEPFWRMVADALKPGGRVFLFDEAATRSETYTPRDCHDRQPRNLNDGRSFTIIKLYYDHADLAQSLERLGWSADIRCTPNQFLYGVASRRGEA